MKIGIISDIHNNAVALSAMLKKFKMENCSKIICCGDIIGIGPYPEQTVKLMMEIPQLLAVQGNHDRYFTEGMPIGVPNDDQMELGEIEHHKWEHLLLSKQSHDFLSLLPYRIDTVIDKVRITVLHYAMNKQNKYISGVRNPKSEDWNNMFSDINSDVIVYGHEHKRTVNYHKNKLFVNCGSLGCPSEEINIARGGILTIDNETATVEPIDLAYDIGNVMSEINRLNYPDAPLIKKVFYGIK